MNQEEYSHYLAKASQLCARKEKCEQDIRQKFIQWGIHDQDQDRLIEQLKDSDFINHQRYAVAFARDKMRFNHWGINKITYALRNKNIEDLYIQHSINQLPKQQYDAILLEELEKKRPRIKAQNAREKKNKLCQFLIQKGFEHGKVFELVEKKLKEYED